MVRCGDPTGNGRVGPGYRFEDEVRDNPLTHEAKVFSMAYAEPNTNGSQLFITHALQQHLNRKHTAFDKVTGRAGVVESIEKGDTLKSVTIKQV